MYAIILRLARLLRGHAGARRRALQLLRRNLTPVQLGDYDRNGSFLVTGGKTGRTYRIRHGWSMNVDELDAAGNVVRTWCFYPKGRLSTGDVMLAQKIALEAFEQEALQLANRMSLRTDPREDLFQ